MRVYSGSDIGLRRDSNQDYCKTGTFSDGAGWAVVCDGMGGANGGCTASSMAAETIAGMLTEQYRPELTDEQVRSLMEQAVAVANAKVYDAARNDLSLRGMGTTVVCAIAHHGRIHIVHAGDSRAYLFVNDSIRRVTTDHSIVQELVDAGQLTEEEAMNHPNRNIITRALGVDQDLLTDYNVQDFEQGAMLIICTDGLSGYFADGALCELIRSNSGEELVNKLIEAAKNLGGSDNITVAVIAADA